MSESEVATAIMPASPELVDALDPATRLLVRLAAVLAVSGEGDIRLALTACVRDVPPEWVEEIVLQTYMFAGFPRALNAAREWRRISGRSAPQDDEGAHAEREVNEWRRRGAETCAIVYGPFYEGLRKNIRDLHPALESWMVVDGYGKVLGRPALDLLRRELCVVAICAAAKQDRQLHSHLHGAVHAGATTAQVDATLGVVDDMLDANDARRYRHLWARVQRK